MNTDADTAQRFAEQDDKDLALGDLNRYVALQANKAVVSKAFGIIARWPDCTEAWTILIGALFREGEGERAMIAADTAVKTVPDPWWIFFTLGVVNRQQKKPDRAMAFYRRALDVCPTFPEAASNLASLLLERGQIDEALAIVERAYADHPDHAVLMFSIGRAHRARRDNDKARAAFRAAIALDPAFVQAYASLADVENALGLSASADAASARAGLLAPDEATSHHNAALTLFQIGQYEGAVQSLRRAIAVDPSDAHHYKNLSYLLSLIGAMDQALDADERAVYLVPDRANLMANRILMPHSTRAAEYDWFFEDPL